MSDANTPKTREVISHNQSETFDLGEDLGRELSGGEIILLNGPLGAGKTMLVKGIAAALGIDQEDVTSPSFTLVNPHPGRLLLYHIDLYRLDEGATAAHAVDLDEILTDENAVVIIEWAERLGHYPLPEVFGEFQSAVTVMSRDESPSRPAIRIERDRIPSKRK